MDIGGVKAGVGAEVTEAEEIAGSCRSWPAVRARFPDLPISVDTWRAGVAVAACEAGADLINDTWAGADPALAEVAARFGAGIVCSHTGGAVPRTNPYRVSLPRRGRCGHRADHDRRGSDGGRSGCRGAGVLIDPTHDFGKNTWHSLELVHRTGELVATGWPVLMALSNKDFIGETLDLPVDQRLEGTLAVTAIAAWLGAAVVRAHQCGADPPGGGHGRRGGRDPGAGRRTPGPGLTDGVPGTVGQPWHHRRVSERQRGNHRHRRRRPGGVVERARPHRGAAS